MSLLARLIEAGTPPDLIAEVAREIGRLEGQCDALERRRASDRERQADYRRRNATSRDVTNVTNETSPQNVPPHPPINTLPPVDAKASTAPRGRADKGSKIPEDWEPPAVSDLSPEAQALARQWPSGSYRAEAEAFRNFWLAESGAKARKSNWARAWANRIVAIHGKVMRDVKFGHAPAAANDRTAKEPETRDELERALAFAESRGFQDQPRYVGYRQKLEALRREATGPPRPLGELTGNIVARADHGQA